MIVNYTKEHIDYIKKAVEHVDFLTGGSRNSKTKQIIEELQQENSQLKERIDKATECIEKQKTKMYKNRNKIALFVLMKLEKIQKGGK